MEEQVSDLCYIKCGLLFSLTVPATGNCEIAAVHILNKNTLMSAVTY
jgi:hypothetical protein